MRNVMVNDEDVLPDPCAENTPQPVQYLQLLPKLRGRDYWPHPLTFWRKIDGITQHSIQRQHRVLVKCNGIDSLGPADLGDAVIKGGSGKARIVFATAEALFLHSRDDFASSHRSGCRVVIQGRNTNNRLHAVKG